MSRIGTITTGKMVRTALEATIKTWVPTYLAEISRQSGRLPTDLPVFRSYVPAIDFDRFAEDQTPTCVIVAPGTYNEPRKQSNGAYTARWAVGVGCVLVGQDRENTFELTELYAAAVRTLILQQASLGGLSDGVDWVSERYDELSVDDQRTIAAGIIQFIVDVEDVSSRHVGPVTVPLDPYVPLPEDPVVETTHLDTTQADPLEAFPQRLHRSW